jgi:hypothetical protein
MLASAPGRPYCTRLDAYLASRVTCASRGAPGAAEGHLALALTPTLHPGSRAQAGALRARLRAILDRQIPVLAQVPANHLGAAAGRPATSGGPLD